MNAMAPVEHQIAPPDPEKPPLKVNIFHSLRTGNTANCLFFPYLGDGDIVVSGTAFVGGKGRETGVFQHFNTRDELSVVFAAHGVHLRPGDTVTGAREHSVGGYFADPEDPEALVVLNVIQRQSDAGVEQSEAMIWLCENCQAPVMECRFAAKTGKPGVPGYAPPLEAIVESAVALEAYNETDAARTCSHCGFVNKPFPVSVWGWDAYNRNYVALEKGRKQFLAAAATGEK
ncbi:MAG: hypothetical protein JWR80_5288 [Bradyrhizobium sp.]|nr:hypothetical protein [Bradyrhizobium sp.]